jgi:glutathione S-transferase
LAPPADRFSLARVDYLQMLHYGTSWMDMMLWQIRVHTHLLGNDRDDKTIARYHKKFIAEVEPQLSKRLNATEHICGAQFSAVDCVMGQNVSGPKRMALPGEVFANYIRRLRSAPPL